MTVAVAGLVGTPFSVTVHALILLLLTWPLIKKMITRRRTVDS